MVQSANKAFNFYSELHMNKQNAWKQALITKFVRPHAPNVTPDSPIPGTSTDDPIPSLPSAEHLFTEDEMEEFEGFFLAADVPSSSGGSR